MEYSLIIPAFVAGLLTFLAPCTLPLVPAYIGFISGISIHDLHNPEKSKFLRKQILTNGLLFVIGFTIVFIGFGSLAGLLGQNLISYRLWLSRIGGLMVIIFGLFILGAFRVNFLLKEKRFKPPKFLTLGRPLSSFVIGATFAFGWTPCVGPILGSILLLASTSGTTFQGAFLLIIFSMGLAIPFLLVAAGLGSASRYINKITRYLKAISFIGGLFLIILGLLLLTNNFNLIISYGFKFFSFIKYENLINHL